MHFKHLIMPFLFLVLVVLPLGCGGSSEDDNTEGELYEDITLPPIPSEDTIEEPDPTNDFGVEFTIKGTETISGGRTIYFTRYIPDGCDSATPCPVVVLVPNGLMGGDEFFGDDLPRWLAAKSGIIVVTYNPPGRGKTNRVSDGVEDYNGNDGQDALSDVLNYMIKNIETNDRVGVISFGFGLSAAAGALARFQPNKLSEVDFLIDVEGPINRCFITSHPANIDAGFDGDGDGVNDIRCDFDIGPREEAFPFDFPNDVPPSVVCNVNAFPIAQTGADCTDDVWWASREPKLYLKKLQGNYLRLQMRYDHAQPSRWSALEAIKYVILSNDVDQHQLNDVLPNKPLHTSAYGDKSLLADNAYLDFSNSGLGNNLLFPQCVEDDCTQMQNPYSGAFDDLKAMTLESFFKFILFQYADRMIEQ
jgi:hypothetical protein